MDHSKIGLTVYGNERIMKRTKFFSKPLCHFLRFFIVAHDVNSKWLERKRVYVYVYIWHTDVGCCTAARMF